MGIHEYAAHLKWEGNTGCGTASYEGYGRSFRIRTTGKPDLVGTADPAFRGTPDRHNPEDLFLGAIAACHMLTYLALCARRGVRVVAYEDEARGRLVTDDPGGGRFAEVLLHPLVTIEDEAQSELAAELHEEARARCFIANSCAIPLRHLATVRTSTREPETSCRPDSRGEFMVDLAIELEDRPGALAEMGEALGRAGVSVEGGGAFVVDGRGVARFLFEDGAAARTALEAAGIRVLEQRNVLFQRLDQARPGQVGELTRQMAEAGVNIEALYSDHDHRLVLVVDDLDAGRGVSETWMRRRSGTAMHASR